jgi:hypothetical protein
MNWFERIVVKRIFHWIARKLDGHKTQIGGVGMILGGLGFAANGIVEDSYEQIAAGVLGIGKGLEAIGLAAKFEKQTSATRKQATAIIKPRVRKIRASVAILFAMLVSSAAVEAQDAQESTSRPISIEIGARSYARYQVAFHGCLIVPLVDDESTSSVSCVDLKGLGGGNGQAPVTTTVTGISQLLFRQGRLAGFGLLQVGTAVAEETASGMVNAGFCATYDLTARIDLVTCGTGAKAPALGAWQSLPTIGIRFIP